MFTINRTASGAPVTVAYTISGTAANGVDYTNALGGALSGTITFDAAATSTNITIIPVDDAAPEALETVVLSIAPSLNYVGAGNTTVVIVDNEPAQLAITLRSTSFCLVISSSSIMKLVSRISGGLFLIRSRSSALSCPISSSPGSTAMPARPSRSQDLISSR
jgi:hypothetical protein